MLICCLFATLFIQAQVEYPYPIQKFNITLEGKPVQIAYMDAKPDSANYKTVMLFHGKNGSIVTKSKSNYLRTDIKCTTIPQ